MALVRLPKTAQNPLTSTGIFLTTVSALLFVLLFFVDLFGLHTNPYLGMVAFLVLPAFFLLGLVLIPVGMVRERQRLARGLGPEPVDLGAGRPQRAAPTEHWPVSSARSASSTWSSSAWRASRAWSTWTRCRSAARCATR